MFENLLIGAALALAIAGIAMLMSTFSRQAAGIAAANTRCVYHGRQRGTTTRAFRKGIMPLMQVQNIVNAVVPKQELLDAQWNCYLLTLSTMGYMMPSEVLSRHSNRGHACSL